MLKEAVKEGNMYNVFQKLNNLEITSPITLEYLKESKRHDVQLPAGVTLSKDIDWSNSREVFNFLSFDDTNFSNTPEEHLPEGYAPKQVFENGKSIGLGISEVHDARYTGEGASFAIIDSGVTEHYDIHFKEYRVSDFANKESLYPIINVYRLLAYYYCLSGNSILEEA